MTLNDYNYCLYVESNYCTAFYVFNTVNMVYIEQVILLLINSPNKYENIFFNLAERQ